VTLTMVLLQLVELQLKPMLLITLAVVAEAEA
jgi:hypothetical protein